MTFVNLLKKSEDLICGKPSSIEAISESENKLQARFSYEYREYLLSMSLAMFDGHELTGITNQSRLNVVEATQEYREKNKNVMSDLYVVENLHIDGIIILQNSDGQVFESANNQIRIIANSLSDYYFSEKHL